jgi:glycerol-3-phosphate dehydrogenase (NAD(P)+)
MALAERHGIEMPISRDVYDVLQSARSPGEIFRGLLRTAAGSEADAG